MQVVRVFIPELGEATFKAVEVDEKATVREVQQRLTTKLINAGTIAQIDSTQFNIFECKNNSGKDKKLDSTQKIFTITKKWASSTSNYKLLFKGVSDDIKLPIIHHTPSSTDANISKSTMPPEHPTSPTIPTPPSTIATTHATPPVTIPIVPNTLNQLPANDIAEDTLPPANDGTQESALEILTYFAKEYASNRIHTMYDIIVALGG